MHIPDKVFLVTGAASGLGAATARALLAAGGKVLLVDRDAAVATRAAELGSNGRGLVADITGEAAARGAVGGGVGGVGGPPLTARPPGRGAVAGAVEAFGALHGLVNCAGVVGGEKLLGRNGPHALDSFARIVAVNLIGTFNMLRLVAEAMAEGAADEGGERGVPPNPPPTAPSDGKTGQPASGAPKGGVAALTLPAARELARHGIRVMTVAPGVFETPMMAGMSTELREALAAGVPFPPRLGRPEEFAALVRHIVENPMLNGEVIRLDGALRMAAK